MNINTGLRGRSPILRRGQLITVDYYKADIYIDDMDLVEKIESWFIENSDDGIGVKVVDYNEEKQTITIENCPYEIPAEICVKD